MKHHQPQQIAMLFVLCLDGSVQYASNSGTGNAEAASQKIQSVLKLHYIHV